jgi:hypothetical protein
MYTTNVKHTKQKGRKVRDNRLPKQHKRDLLSSGILLCVDFIVRCRRFGKKTYQSHLQR